MNEASKSGGSLELLLLRHAKSAWGDPQLDDHDRGLAPRGVTAAKRVAGELKARGLVPDLVLCSTATRAVRTWEIASAALDPAPPCRHMRQLYLAPPDRLLGIVREQPASVRRLLLIGHDPGMHGLAVALADDGPAAERRALEAKLPTGALVQIAFAVSTWGAVDEGSGRLLAFVRPRDLD